MDMINYHLFGYIECPIQEVFSNDAYAMTVIVTIRYSINFDFTNGSLRFQ
jgi:hypothetical protein